MRYRFIWLILLGLFVCEGSLFPWLIPKSWTAEMLLSPHFTLLGILYIAIFAGRHMALIYGLVFGFLQDLVYYGHMLGPHMFAIGIIGYFAGLLFRRFRVTLLSHLAILACGFLAYDALLFGIYHFFAVADYQFDYVLTHAFLPGLLINLLAALVLYIPARVYFEGWSRVRRREET